MEMKQRLNKENTTQPTDQHLGPSRNSLKRNITIGRMLSHTQTKTQVQGITRFECFKLKISSMPLLLYNKYPDFSAGDLLQNSGISVK